MIGRKASPQAILRKHRQDLWSKHFNPGDTQWILKYPRDKETFITYAKRAFILKKLDAWYYNPEALWVHYQELLEECSNVQVD